MQSYVLPAAVGILIALFAVQQQGTARIGQVMGPVMLLWFVVMALLGVWGIVQHPAVLWALNPAVGLRYLFGGGATALPVLGGVFLCATGAEVLYADMGHFGRLPIRLVWSCLGRVLINTGIDRMSALSGEPDTPGWRERRE
jgi:KUP system potassium uptake protein